MLATYSGVLSRPSILNAAHARSDQFRDQCIRRQILRAQQVLLITQVDIPAVADELVGQAAGLGTLAPIRTPPAQRFTRQALATVRHAQRPVDEPSSRTVVRA